MIEFDPNTQASAKIREYVFATYIPDRSPQFKRHWHLGQAKNAITYMHRHDGALMYRWVDGRWVEIFRMSPEDYRRPANCEECGTSFQGMWSDKLKWSGTPDTELALSWVCRQCS